MVVLLGKSLRGIGGFLAHAPRGKGEGGGERGSEKEILWRFPWPEWK